jgi:hypothetical protein
MSGELISFEQLNKMAHVMSKSGLFGKKQEEMASLMLLAQAQGQHPATVAMEYDVIQGRPAINARSAQARFQTAGGKINWITRSDLEASAKFTHEAGGELVIKWTIERAKQAGLTGKDNWRKYPAQMLSARVIAEGVRAVFPACLSGFYTVEELHDIPSDLVSPQAAPEQVKSAMPDPLEVRVNKMLDYMEAAGISEQSVLEYLKKNHCTMIDEADLENLATLVKECTKLASAAGEPVNVTLGRCFNKSESTENNNNNGEQNNETV